MNALTLTASCRLQSSRKCSWLCRAAAAVCALLATLPAAAGVANAKFDRRDFNGVWFRADTALDAGDGSDTGASDHKSGPATLDFDTEPQLKGKYLQNYARLKQARAKAGIDIMVSCRPNGMPVLMIGPYATEILQTAKQINWFQEFPGETRRIYLDGRPHPNPDEYPATYTGHSTGKWDGNTLVVETVNIRTDTLLDSQGHMENGEGHSAKLRIVERFWLLDADHLRIESTVEDSDALVRPWRYGMTFHRHRDGEIEEYICEDNNRESVDPKTGRELTEIPPRKNQQ